MTMLNAFPATLAAVLASAVAGDTLQLFEGSYGDVSIRRLNFAQPIRLVCADPAKPPVLRSLLVSESQGVDLEGLTFAYTPNAATLSFSAVVRIVKSAHVRVMGGEITSGPAVNGVAASALELDSTGNVVGLPTCRGVSLEASQDIAIEGVHLHHLHRGVIVDHNCARVNVWLNEIDHTRKSCVMGGCDDLVVEANRLHSVNPWRYGQTPEGDHADYIALLNGGTDPISKMTVRANRMWRGAGAPLMGGWVQGKVPGLLVYEFEDNLIVGGDHQGLIVSDVKGGSIRGNVMLQDDLAGKPIGIILQTSTANLAVSDNLVGSLTDKALGAGGNKLADNLLLQGLDAAKAAYYGADLLAAVLKEPSIVAIRAMVRAGRVPPVVEPPPPPKPDELRLALAARVDAKIEPLKTKGRLIVNFRTPAQADAALAAVLAIKA